MKATYFIKLLLIPVLLCLTGTSLPVFAAKAPPGNCSTGDVSSSINCIGGVTGNDSTNWLNSNSAFGFNDWIFAERDEGVEVEDIDVGLVITPPVTGNARSGTWSLDSDIFSRYENVILTLKPGNAFSLYLLSGDFTSGTWDVQGWTQNGLSHATIYVRGTAVVPVPAAVWLFVSGLLGMLAFTNRKRSF